MRVADDGLDLLAPRSRPIATASTGTVAIAWRRFPDPAHPRAAVLALAAEAAAAQGRLWAMTRERLSARHPDPAELSAAMVRAGLDPARTRGAMRAGTGADRIVADTASALASGSDVHPCAAHRRRVLSGERP